jgi:ribonuclease G
MGKNILVVSCDVRETRVALIEDGIIAELHIERRGSQPKGGTVGDVYLGKVTRVLPGLQAAFIDIGLERAAFLHVEDLIRPDDFEAYLAGGRKHAKGAVQAGPSANGHAEEQLEAMADAEVDAEAEAAADEEQVVAQEALEAGPEAAASAPALDVGDASGDQDADARPAGDEVAEAHADADADAEVDAEAEVDARAGAEADGDDDADSDDDGGGESHRDLEAAVADEGRRAEAPPSAQDLADDEGPATDPSLGAAPPPAADVALDDPDLPGFTIHDPGAPVPKAPAPRLESAGGDRERRGRRGRRGRDRRGGGGGGGDRDRGGRDRGGRDRGDRGGRGGRGRDHDRDGAVPGRISKSTPIRDVVREGQEIIVQVTKEPIGTKGARCSSHVSLPGRYVVYLPTVDHIGVSKRIGSDRERARLREAIEGMKPPTGGLIVRTVAEGLTKKQMKQDVGYLVRLWGEIAKKREGAKAPALLGSELDIVLKIARDLFTDEVAKIVIDDKTQYVRLLSFVEMFLPDRVKDVEFYDDEEPIFDAYGIEDEIGRALSRKVPLPSGGYLIIDQAEALTAIDVNTGRFVGKGSKDMEETILKTNLEAVQEIAYQLRFRNIGGLIILDLIDMERAANREKVRRKLEDVLQKDKAKTTLNRISELGLMEMTRKRTRESLGRLLHEPCFYCDGTGHLQSKETIAYEILREIRRKRADLPGYTVLVNCHPAVADLLTGSEKAAVADAENRYMRKINVQPRKEYHLEQFDLTGK